MNQHDTSVIRIAGRESGVRLESRVLEERIQEAVAQGCRTLEIEAMGQHGIGGRLWTAGDDQVQIQIKGPPGQRTGAMGFPNTSITVAGNVSDDVGWLNAGAEIVVHGHASNGAANAMAQGRIMIGGNIGARGMTMTKHNPRFDPPELWVLGSVGDYFAEFMAGGIAVVCGVEPQSADNVLGYRPCVGMVSGKIYFRGPHQGFSQADATLVPISDRDWNWLTSNLESFLERLGQEELFAELARREDWQLLRARTPQEKRVVTRLSMSGFHSNVWDQELGSGGLIGDISDESREAVPVITTGELRRFVPVWENKTYTPPCEASCPTGIPVHERWRLIREGRVDEAVDLALAYTPFPATVCGYLCPNLCMQSCTKHLQSMPAVDVTLLGQASIEAHPPELPEATGARVGVIGGGPAGISAAWQLRQAGHRAVVYDQNPDLGGKIREIIPKSRIPQDVLDKELQRVKDLLETVNLQQPLQAEDLERLRDDFDYLVLATGAQKPRELPLSGKERLIPALEFLRQSHQDKAEVGTKVVVIGAGNVGCDAATEAHRLGAEEITLIDIQEPASFGKEREAAEAVGARFRWPVFTKEITPEGVLLTSGELLPADTVIMSVGDVPDLSYLPDTVRVEKGFVQVDENYQTSDPRIFAIGDLVRPGLITDGIGAGRRVSRVIDEISKGRRPRGDVRAMIDRSRVKLEYFDPRIRSFSDLSQCAGECASCGACRDCGICVALCPQSAISRQETAMGEVEMVVDPERCIGCGFCAGACPCGIWDLVENEVLI